jgi:hypothetical protein
VDTFIEELPMGTVNNHGDVAGLGWLQLGADLETASTVRTASYNRAWPARCSFTFTASGLCALGANIMRVQAWGIRR